MTSWFQMYIWLRITRYNILNEHFPWHSDVRRDIVYNNCDVSLMVHDANDLVS